MSEDLADVYMKNTKISAAREGYIRASNFLKLEFLIVVNDHEDDI